MSGSLPVSTATPHRARRFLRWLALIVVVAVAVFWWSKGSHLGWSQNQVPVRGVDEFTGLDYVRYEERFVPGVEFLAAGVGAAALLFGSSFLIRFNSSPRNP